MTELDAIVEQCRGRGTFAKGFVRDSSNRSNREWPWWGVQIEQTYDDGLEKRRAIATVRLNSTISGEPGSFHAWWLVRVWQGVSVDSFREEGGWPLNWEQPSPQLLDETMAALLQEAQTAIARALTDRI